MAEQDATNTFAEYRSAIKAAADDVETGVREHGEHVAEAISESADGSYWVMNTNAALKTLEYAENQPDEWKHLVGDDASWQEVVMVMAYTCFEMDVYDELNRRDVLSDLQDLTP